MSVCGQSGHTEEDSASEEIGVPFRDKTSDIYNQKPASKVVRVLTVLAYLLSVSLAAILLSVYYICVWKSPELPLSEPIELNARRGNRSDYGEADYAGKPFFFSAMLQELDHTSNSLQLLNPCGTPPAIRQYLELLLRKPNKKIHVLVIESKTSPLQINCHLISSDFTPFFIKIL
ncbi:unnamed protein product [Arctia plantaginis]|uniref:Uncharacterized protein n=1 Tax=Arctia plantaginis TaxID=874455 RepID=A0A8S1AW19_ARCPL|nr:unnamed protein product [Arctia plantaginis]